MPKKKRSRVGLTGNYKFSGHVTAMREYLRLTNRIAELEPEELPKELVEDLKLLAQEASMVAEFVGHRYEEVNRGTVQDG
jgi:hypothetical protein